MKPHSPEPAPETIRAVLLELTADLRAAGIESPGNDARRLVAAALGLSGAELLAAPERALTRTQSARLAVYAQRRRRREPVSRILGLREFYGRRFAISPATLDPRPDSETLIDAALGVVREEEGWGGPKLRILDVGTGSGCLLLTLLAEFQEAQGLGTDIDPAALDIATANAVSLGLAGRSAWRVADALDDVRGPYQMLICNPPYIRTEELVGLEPEVRDYDPRGALDGGADGLRVYRRVVERIPAVVPDGWVIFEVGHDQADAVADVLRSISCRVDPSGVRFYRDVTGKRRCVAARTRQ